MFSDFVDMVILVGKYIHTCKWEFFFLLSITLFIHDFVKFLKFQILQKQSRKTEHFLCKNIYCFCVASHANV